MYLHFILFLEGGWVTSLHHSEVIKALITEVDVSEKTERASTCPGLKSPRLTFWSSSVRFGQGW